MLELTSSPSPISWRTDVGVAEPFCDNISAVANTSGTNQLEHTLRDGLHRDKTLGADRCTGWAGGWMEGRTGVAERQTRPFLALLARDAMVLREASVTNGSPADPRCQVIVFLGASAPVDFPAVFFVRAMFHGKSPRCEWCQNKGSWCARSRSCSHRISVTWHMLSFAPISALTFSLSL